MTISKKDLDALINIDMSDEARQAFLHMPREEQLLAILGMDAYLRAKLALLEKKITEFEADIQEYRRTREKKENLSDKTDRIAREIVRMLKKE